MLTLVALSQFKEVSIFNFLVNYLYFINPNRDKFIHLKACYNCASIYFIEVHYIEKNRHLNFLI